jgi:RND family efflux transporter MFP subunit
LLGGSRRNNRRRWLFGLLVAGAGLSIGGLTAAFSGSSGVQGLPGAGPPAPVVERGELSVNTVVPQLKTLVRTFEQPGSIKPWAHAELFAKTSGYLKRIARDPGVNGGPGPDKDIGSQVKAGEVLLEIDVPDLQQDVTLKESQLKQYEAELERARADVAAFQATVAFQTKQLGRIRDLVKFKTVTEELADEKESELLVATSRLANARAEVLVKESRIRVARDELERARIVAEFARVQAPFDGVITYRGVDPGDFVQNATTGQPRPLFSVAAVEEVKIILQVPEKEAVWMHVGTEAHIRLDALPNGNLEGRVARVSPVLDPQSRTRQVEIDLANSDRKLLPGMYAEVTLILQKIDNAQAIPATAVYSRRGVTYILQVVDGLARRLPVRIRYDDGKELEVVKVIGDKEIALDGTEELIVSNKGEVADGQHVKPHRLPSH